MTRMLKLRRRPTMLRKQTLLRKTKRRNPVTSPLAERIRKKRRKRSQQLGEIKRREVMTVVEVKVVVMVEVTANENKLW